MPKTEFGQLTHLIFYETRDLERIILFEGHKLIRLALEANDDMRNA